MTLNFIYLNHRSICRCKHQLLAEKMNVFLKLKLICNLLEEKLISFSCRVTILISINVFYYKKSIKYTFK